MQEILRLQMKIVPELVELLEKRYNILRTIYYKQPIGRRVLANDLNLGERIVRTEINFFKNHGLIKVNTPGMTVTEDGEQIINELKDFIHEIRGLSSIEHKVQKYLGLQKVIIVPGDTDSNPTVLKDIGKACAGFIKGVVKSNDIVALTGGSTIKEVVEALPEINSISNVLVVPARGGMGRKVETQANTLAALFAKKLNGSYKLLHIPENLSSDILETLLKEKEISDIIKCIQNADILIYGIGNAIEMAEKRGMAQKEVDRLKNMGAVGEAFGCYFNKQSQVISHATSVGINISQVKKINMNIAVAGGKNKIEPVISTMRNNPNGILVTDEAIGKGIVEYFENTALNSL